MLTPLGKDYTTGTYLIYHDIGPLVPGGSTRKFEVSNKKGMLLGYIKWNQHWRKYCLFPLNCILDESCLIEIAAFCKQETVRQSANWKDVKYKFRKKYDMTNINKKKELNEQIKVPDAGIDVGSLYSSG